MYEKFLPRVILSPSTSLRAGSAKNLNSRSTTRCFAEFPLSRSPEQSRRGKRRAQHNTLGRNPTFQALILDLGKVVVDYDWEPLLALLARRSGKNPEAVRQLVWSDESLHLHELGLIDRFAYRRRINVLLGTDFTQRVFEAHFCGIFRGLVAGMPELISEVRARGLPVCALSNINRLHLEHLNAAYPALKTLFDRGFYSCEIGRRKPDRAAYEYVLAALGLHPGACFFADDLPDNVAAAAALGLAAHCFQSAEKLRAELLRRGVL